MDQNKDVLVFYGALQKNDATSFTDEERDSLLYKGEDTFLEWCERHNIGYGGSLQSPPTPDDRRIAFLEKILREISSSAYSALNKAHSSRPIKGEEGIIP